MRFLRLMLGIVPIPSLSVAQSFSQASIEGLGRLEDASDCLP